MTTESANRALDKRIAELLGWEDVGEPESNPNGGYMGGTPPNDSHTRVPNFSTGIGAAQSIIDKWDGDFEAKRRNGYWYVTFFRPSREFQGWAETFPLAVCVAALRALESKP